MKSDPALFYTKEPAGGGVIFKVTGRVWVQLKLGIPGCYVRRIL